MANTSRRYIDRNGNMFIPMNVEGGTWEDHFITTPKLVAIALMVGSYIISYAWLVDVGAKLSGYILITLILTFINQFVLRYFIFEEKYYYRVYKKLKEQEITTPASFWDVASLKHTPEGDIITYSDGRIGVIVKLDRDTIIGKPEDFKEDHYDALSDFYKSLTNSKLNFVQMNIMEPAGNDPRIMNLDKLVNKSSNPNICKLMEREIGYIKNITRATLYESDYFLIYTHDTSRIDYLIQDVIDSLYILLDGGYVGYQILFSKDIIELVKKMYGVKYFNYTEATLDMYKYNGVRSERPFNITGIKFNDGDYVNFNSADKNKIYSMTSEILGGTLNIKDVSIKSTVHKEEKKEYNGVDIESVSAGYTPMPENNPNMGNRPGRPSFGGRSGKLIRSDKANRQRKINNGAMDPREQFFDNYNSYGESGFNSEQNQNQDYSQWGNQNDFDTQDSFNNQGYSSEFEQGYSEDNNGDEIVDFN